MKYPFFLIIFLLSQLSIKSQDYMVPMDFPTIQEALDNASDGSIILVAPGIYYENLVWPEDIDGIQLIGEMGSDSTIIDANEDGRVLLKDKYIDNGSIIQGFTLRNGRASEGAGLLIEGRGTELIDLNITRNETSGLIHCDGGGVRLESYSGIIRDCNISGNKGSGGWTSYGGGISIELSGNIEIRNTRIAGNTSKGGNSASTAGMTIDGFSHTVSMTNVTVLGNRNIHDQYGFTPGASISGGRIVIDSCGFSGNSSGNATDSNGGGLSISTRDGLVTNSTFNSNSGKFGPGIRIYGSENEIEFSNLIIDNNSDSRAIALDCSGSVISFENCLITRNKGFSIYINANFNESFNWLKLNHVTSANNDMGIFSQRSRFEFNNCIFWDYLNSTPQIHAESFGSITGRSSIVKGGFSQGNLILDEDPLLDPIGFIPGYNSPATGYANPNFSPMGSLNGLDRPTPLNTLPDLGAIETNQALSFGDVRFFYDANQDGLKNDDDFNLSIGAVNYRDVVYSNFDHDGISLALPMGMNVLEYENQFNPNWNLTTDQIINRDIVDSTYYEELLFGLFPDRDTMNVQSYISMGAFRCDEYVDASIKVSNEFLVLDEVYVWLQLDERIEGMFFEVEPDIISSEHLVAWKINDLLPTLDREIKFELLVPGISDPSELNEIYYFKSWCEDFESTSEHIYTPQIRCSYDPNDKFVNPIRADQLALESTPLDYTIRFQNTGNDYAKDVTIIDTLSTYIDPLSFKYINSSHPENLIISRLSDYIMEFEFKDIFLIDSLTNEELSKGFVSFRVNPLQDLNPDTQIENTAYIIFDSNPTIITNTVKTTIVDFFPTSSKDVENDITALYPNPTRGEIYFDIKADEVEVFDISGKLLLVAIGVDRINIEDFESGNYYVRITKEGQTSQIQIVKE